VEQVESGQQVVANRRASPSLEDITTARRDSGGLRWVNVILRLQRALHLLRLCRCGAGSGSSRDPETIRQENRQPMAARATREITLLGQKT